MTRPPHTHKKPSSSQAIQGLSVKRPAQKKALAYNDIDVSQWRDYPDVETDSLWLFEGRDRQNGHQLDYHGNCVPQILTQLLTRYTRQNDVILDLFLGSGTSAIEAANMGRKTVGVELNPDMVQYVSDKLIAQFKQESAVLLQGNSSSRKTLYKPIEGALQQLGKKQANFLFLHPPYADIIQFSGSPHDLSNASTTQAFLDQFYEVCQLGYDCLEPGRFAGLVIGDKYTSGSLIPLGFYCMEQMNRAGFKTKSIVVKNISGNEKAKGRMSNLWRYRALAGGFYIFKHEYVFVFQKPKTDKKK
jgi:hypothetical protein